MFVNSEPTGALSLRRRDESRLTRHVFIRSVGMSEKDEKKRALDLALAQIEKQYGKGAVMKLGDADAPADIPAISTGSLGLDIALCVGGFPRGRVIEIFGPEASGKTTLTLHAIAEV